MNIRLTIFALITCLMAGCLSVEGTYYPGCVAYEGSKIHFSDGEFAWDRFTDQVVVDEDGNVVDQFPNYPKHGTYRVDGKVLYMDFDAADSTETMHVHQHEGHMLLLTEAQTAAWQQTGQYDDCVLTRENKRAN